MRTAKILTVLFASFVSARVSPLSMLLYPTTTIGRSINDPTIIRSDESTIIRGIEEWKRELNTLG